MVAGRALDAVESGQTFKAYCSKTKIGTIDFLLASETLKYKSLIASILDSAAVTAKSLDINSKGMLYVMIYELLFGKGKIRGGGSVKRRINEVLQSLQLVLQDMMSAQNATLPADLLPSHIKVADESLRQYLRINMLKVDKTNIDSVMNAIKTKCPGVDADVHIPHLFALPARSPSFGEHPLVKQGTIIIQDKASCFPAQLLMDEWEGGDVIDACAAPGNKTTHLAACMKERRTSGVSGTIDSKIYAFDKDTRRAKLLQERIVLAGAKDMITVTNADFLTVDVSSSKYSSVRCILLDPSCSGSGVARSLDRLGTDVDSDATRLSTLRNFQIQAIRKSFTFPKVTTIVYSTCSIHAEENESVVAEVLSGSEWNVIPPPRLTSWRRRGLPYQGLTADQSSSLIRALPEDGMIGFFVAVFRRSTAAMLKRKTWDEIDPSLAVHEGRVDPTSARRRKIWRPLDKRFAF